MLAATTLFVALGGAAAVVLPHALTLAVAVFLLAATLVLPGVVLRRRRYALLQDAVAHAPHVVARLQASLDAAAPPWPSMPPLASAVPASVRSCSASSSTGPAVLMTRSFGGLRLRRWPSLALSARWR